MVGDFFGFFLFFSSELRVAGYQRTKHYKGDFYSGKYMKDGE